MYDPEIARFLSEDTYRGDIKDPLSLNVYSYLNNNPVTYTDSDGHIGITAIFGVAVIGGIIGLGVKALTKCITTGSAKLSFKEVAGATLKEVLSTAVKFTGIGIGAIFGDASEQKINTDRVNWVSASKTGGFCSRIWI